MMGLAFSLLSSVLHCKFHYCFSRFGSCWWTVSYISKPSSLLSCIVCWCLQILVDVVVDLHWILFLFSGAGCVVFVVQDGLTGVDSEIEARSHGMQKGRWLGGPREAPWWNGLFYANNWRLLFLGACPHVDLSGVIAPGSSSRIVHVSGVLYHQASFFLAWIRGWRVLCYIPDTHMYLHNLHICI